jgi:hypothetical protein
MTPPRGKDVRRRLLGFHAPIAFFNTLDPFCDEIASPINQPG